MTCACNVNVQQYMFMHMNVHVKSINYDLLYSATPQHTVFAYNLANTHCNIYMHHKPHVYVDAYAYLKL